MGTIIETITDIYFTFDADCGLAVYLTTGKHSTYITSLFELNYIKQIINEGKTGHSADTFNQKQLESLIGNKVEFYKEDKPFGDAHYKYVLTKKQGDVL